MANRDAVSTSCQVSAAPATSTTATLVPETTGSAGVLPPVGAVVAAVVAAGGAGEGEVWSGDGAGPEGAADNAVVFRIVAVPTEVVAPPADGVAEVPGGGVLGSAGDSDVCSGWESDVAAVEFVFVVATEDDPTVLPVSGGVPDALGGL